jgi:hypothetical protein
MMAKSYGSGFTIPSHLWTFALSRMNGIGCIGLGHTYSILLTQQEETTVYINFEKLPDSNGWTGPRIDRVSHQGRFSQFARQGLLYGHHESRGRNAILCYRLRQREGMGFLRSCLLEQFQK